MSAPTNSLQQPRVRRSNAGSPGGSSCRLHPIRATVPYQLLRAGQCSPTRSQTLHGGATNSRGSSPTASPQLGHAAHTPGSPLTQTSVPCQLSKLQVRSSSAIRRASSLDAITGPYLTGQWPRDSHGPYPSCMKDKATQTPGLWNDEGAELGSPHQRSASWGSADHLKEVFLLPTSLEVHQNSKRRLLDISVSTLIYVKFITSARVNTRSALKTAPLSAQHNSAFPAAPLTKTLICRVPSNVEGINHELENVFIREDWEQGMQAMEAVDGRRPPFPTHRHSSGGNTRDTDTQAPSSGDSSPSPRPCSANLLQSPGGSPCSAEDTDKGGFSSPLPKFATSPKPNNSYMFKREPPEGCEKVKVFDESGKSKGFPLFSCPDKNKVNFIPSGSAFCPVKLLCSSLFSTGSGLHSNSSQVLAGDGSADSRGGGTSGIDGQSPEAEAGRDGSAQVLLTS
uniref:Glucocorticoid induced 1 n=1 Tax=Oryzias sinensis TaxID=183150 RepID=A0A8C7X2Y5_9TELE